MMPDDARTQQIAIPEVPVSLDELLSTANLPVSLRIMLDDRLYEKTKQLAGVMARADGFTPKHLMNKPEACFIVVSCALNWKIDPNFVARSTYQTPGGSIGFEGKLVQAVLEQSGRLVGGVTYEHTGDWNRVLGKYQIVTGGSGKPYPKPTWTPQDAVGLGVIVRAQIEGEASPRVWPAEGQPFQLTQCFPLNSPLWATDPKTQIGYLAVRRFANQAVPHLLGGMPFDENELMDASERARDVTHSLQEAPQTIVPEPIPWEVCDAEGEVYKFERSNSAIEACRKILIASAADPAKLATAWENNAGFILSLGQEGLEPEAQGIERLYAELMPQPQPETEAVVGDLSAAAAARVIPGVKDNERPVRQEPEDLPYEGNPLNDGRQGTEAGWDASTCPHGTDESEGWCAQCEAGLPGPSPQPAEPVGEQTAPETATAAPEPQPAPTARVERPQPSTDPFWKRPSLKIDPPPVRGGGSLSKLDWKSWPALMLPRIRQVWTKDLLNRLYQDNHALLDVFESACGTRERNEIDAAFDDARTRLS